MRSPSAAAPRSYHPPTPEVEWGGVRWGGCGTGYLSGGGGWRWAAVGWHLEREARHPGLARWFRWAGPHAPPGGIKQRALPPAAAAAAAQRTQHAQRSALTSSTLPSPSESPPSESESEPELSSSEVYSSSSSSSSLPPSSLAAAAEGRVCLCVWQGQGGRRPVSRTGVMHIGACCCWGAIWPTIALASNTALTLSWPRNSMHGASCRHAQPPMLRCAPHRSYPGCAPHAPGPPPPLLEPPVVLLPARLRLPAVEPDGPPALPARPLAVAPAAAPPSSPSSSSPSELLLPLGSKSSSCNQYQINQCTINNVT